MSDKIKNVGKFDETGRAIVIRPGQRVVTVDTPLARRHLNKTSLHEALFGGFHADGMAYNYIITGPIRNRPDPKPDPKELRGPKENEVEVEPGVYVEVKSND